MVLCVFSIFMSNVCLVEEILDFCILANTHSLISVSDNETNTISVRTQIILSEENMRTKDRKKKRKQKALFYCELAINYSDKIPITLLPKPNYHSSCWPVLNSCLCVCVCTHTERFVSSAAFSSALSCVSVILLTVQNRRCAVICD